MRYKLMNDYTVDWPFWGGVDNPGLCHDNDPKLPAAIASAARLWAAEFNAFYENATGWPNRPIALAHAGECERIFNEVKLSRPEDEIEFDYWETDIAPPRASS